MKSNTVKEVDELMINQATQDAEESVTTEKTASEQSQPTAEAAAVETAAAPETSAEAPAVAEAPASEAPAEPPAPTPAEAQEAPAEAVPAAPAASEDRAAEAIATPVESAPAPEPASTQAPTPAPEQQASTPAPRTVPAPKPTPAAEEPAASTDIDFGAILEQFEQEQTVFHSGELVTGTVVGITDRGVLVDFGYKSEGFVPPEEFTGPDGEMTAQVGDTVEVVIRSIHSGDGAPQLSRIEALGRKVWDEIEAAYNSGEPIVGKVVDKTKGGLKVEIKGIEAFLPGSQIDSRPIRGLDTYIGEDIEARVIKFSRRRSNVVLSRKVITDEVVNAQKAETMQKIDVGYIVEGTIKNLTEYGAFVDIGGIDGLLHVTDMSWGRIHNPADQFKAGENLQVKILKLDREKEKISLGYKQLQPDPWSTVVEVYPVNTRLKGTVSSVTDYGVFVELEPGVEGLVHVSEISWSRRAQSPKKAFQKGQEVEVQVLGVDTVEKRISLGMKQFLDNPWDMVDIRYPVGSRVQGKVRNITDFGAFVELEEGIDGLVHVSDITWAKKIKHPKDVLKKDQEVEAIVTSIDKRGQRLSLSMKDLTPSAWESFVATHRPGDVVRGKVSRFTNFGIFVELGEGLEGLCHISELSDERVERAEDIAQLGQEMDFKILRIEPAEQKIGLSHRAVGKDDEPVMDTRVYSTEAKGGMASLGELAMLKFGSAAAAEEPVAEAPKEKKKGKKTPEAKVEEAAGESGPESPAPEAEAITELETAEAPAEQAAQAEESASAEETAAEAEGAPVVTAETGKVPVESTEAEAPAIDETAQEPGSEAVETETGETQEGPAAETTEEPAVEAEQPATERSDEAPAATPASEEEASAESASDPEVGQTETETSEEAGVSPTDEAAADDNAVAAATEETSENTDGGEAEQPSA